MERRADTAHAKRWLRAEGVLMQSSNLILALSSLNSA